MHYYSIVLQLKSYGLTNSLLWAEIHFLLCVVYTVHQIHFRGRFHHSDITLYYDIVALKLISV